MIDWGRELSVTNHQNKFQAHVRTILAHSLTRACAPTHAHYASSVRCELKTLGDPNLQQTRNPYRLDGGRLPSCFFVDDILFGAYFYAGANVSTRMHPWSKKMRQGLLARNASNTHDCRRACSPVRLRLRYSDSLAMGPPREKHTLNCISELTALGWWPTGRPQLLNQCKAGCC